MRRGRGKGGQGGREKEDKNKEKKSEEKEVRKKKKSLPTGKGAVRSELERERADILDIKLEFLSEENKDAGDEPKLYKINMR